MSGRKTLKGQVTSDIDLKISPFTFLDHRQLIKHNREHAELKEFKPCIPVII